MSKGDDLREILEKRIRYGDYLLSGVPTERELAAETGVSRMTARKAMLDLIETGLLFREANGRVSARPPRENGTMQIGLIVPSLASPDVETWRLALDGIAGSFGVTVRTIMYLHWDDPVLPQALQALDGAFLYLSAEAVPESVLARIRSAGRPVVVIGDDLTAHGLPSIRLFCPSFIHHLLDILAELGHATCHCFNIQTIDAAIECRIAQWNLWRAHRRIPGKLLGHPIAAYQSPLAAAYAEMGRIFDAGELNATSLLCTTAPAAIGAMRALQDRGIRVGSDISICVFNDEGLGRYLIPSLTSVTMPDLAPYISVCLEWMQRNGDGWIGPLLLQPDRVALFRGESTGPCPKAHPAGIPAGTEML